MKKCPRCQQEPHWHFARNTTMRHNDEQNYFISGGCSHFVRVMGDGMPPIPDKDRVAVEARWETEADAIFVEYVKGWTEAQALTYRMKIWPPQPLPSELFDRNRNEEPAF